MLEKMGVKYDYTHIDVNEKKFLAVLRDIQRQHKSYPEEDAYDHALARYIALENVAEDEPERVLIQGHINYRPYLIIIIVLMVLMLAKMAHGQSPLSGLKIQSSGVQQKQWAGGFAILNFDNTFATSCAGTPTVCTFTSLGGSSTTYQVNGVGLSSSATVNFQNGLGVVITNPSAGNVAFKTVTPFAVTIVTSTSGNSVVPPVSTAGSNPWGSAIVDVDMSAMSTSNTVRFCAMVTTANASSGKAWPQYWTGAAWADLIANGSGVDLTTGSTTLPRCTAWTALPVGAILDAAIRFSMGGGNASAAATIGTITVQFR